MDRPDRGGRWIRDPATQTVTPAAEPVPEAPDLPVAEPEPAAAPVTARRAPKERN